jgi:ankyrin repeat protein
MIAVIENHPESIKALLCGVSNPDALAGTENENGMSTLMLAAEKSNAESIQALLDHIKHPENLIYFSNHHGRTALMYCTLNKNIHQSKNNIISIILEKATKVRDISYRMSPKYKNGENAYISIDRDALIFLHDRDGMNAFMHAASQNNNFAVETLFNWTINKLALLKEKNEKNQSALDLLDKRSCSSLIENLQKIKIADDSPDLDLNAALTLLKERNVQF